MSFMSRSSIASATIERPSPRPVGERGLDRRTGVQRSQHDDRGDRRASELRRDIGGDTGEAKHLDVQHLSGCTNRFEVFSAVVPQWILDGLEVTLAGALSGALKESPVL